MINLKFLLSFTLSALLVTNLINPLGAYASQEVKHYNDVEVHVNNNIDIPDDIIYDIINENPNAGAINIIEYGIIKEVTETSRTQLIEIVPLFLHYLCGSTTTTLNVTIADRFVKDEFKFSVAKGEEVTLGKTYTGTLKGCISGSPFKSGDIGASIEIKADYKRGTTYKGPFESSPCNSRQFRMRFYEEVGNYTQTRMSYLVFEGTTVDQELQTRTGTYNKPTRYVSYSIDTYE